MTVSEVVPNTTGDFLDKGNQLGEFICIYTPRSIKCICTGNLAQGRVFNGKGDVCQIMPA